MKNLAIIRIIEPSSKLQAIELLRKYFNINLSRNVVYKGLPKIGFLKDDIQKVASSFAAKYLSFDFTLVFYDVTTLYFETFKDDEFRKPGFSKDNKPQQPQILIGLLVSREGYPVAVEMFAGNTFEGKTMLPVILAFKAKYNIKTLTIVADAGMLSAANIEELKEYNLKYIVGAGIGNLADDLIGDISSSAAKTEGVFVKRQTTHGVLIVDYSKKRASKDKSDREKQIRKARLHIAQGNSVLQKNRFLKAKTKSVWVINQELVQKDELLDGLKGYYTNVTDIPDELIVARYKDLWHVEKAFRIAKSDLEARPVFHHKEESIKVHILIVFVGLCLSKSVELRTGLSIKKIKDMIWDVLDIEFVDSLTNKAFTRRMEIPDGLEQIQKVMGITKHVLKG